MAQRWIIIGAISGFLAVAIGAFGAHGLEERLDADQLDIYQTGVQYQMFHAIALLVTGMLAQWRSTSKAVQWAGICFTAGTIIFSGSLYTLSLSGIGVFGAITPIGGVAFLTGWLLVIVTASRGKDRA